MKHGYFMLIAIAAFAVALPASATFADPDDPGLTGPPVPAPATAPIPEAAPREARDLFRNDKVWSVELRFAPSDWAAMEPAGGGNMLALMGAMAGGGARGPADVLAAALLKRGDRGRDGRLDRAELDTVAAHWFSLWDNTRSGRLDADTLRSGLKAMLDPEGVFEGKFPVFLRNAPGKRNGLAPAIGIDFKYVKATLAFEGTTLDNVGVRYKGNGTFLESRSTLKRSLKLDLNDSVKGQKLAGRTKLNLHNNVTDASGMIEPIAYGLYRDAGVPAPRTGYAEVFLTVPPTHSQTYLGLYSIVENVDKDFTKDRFGNGKSRGAIFKPTTPSLFADLGDDWSDFRQAYDPKTEVSEAEARRVMEFSKLVSYATDADLAARVGEFLDLDEFARFMAVTAYLASLDSILQVGQNYFLYLDRATNRFQFIPWDLDHSFGRIFGDQDELAKLSIHTPWVGSNRFLERVFGVPAFKALYLARLREFGATIFSPHLLANRVDETAKLIRPSVEGESDEKVALFDQAVADAPTSKALKFVKAFSRPRTQSVIDQLDGKAEGVRPRPAGPGADRGGARSGTGGAGAAAKPQGRSLAAAMLSAFDVDRDGKLTRDEFTAGFGRWFAEWSKGQDQGLTEEQLRDAIRIGVFPPPTEPPPAR